MFLIFLPHLNLPDHHDVRGGDVVLRRLHGNLAAAAEQGPKDFQELLLVPGVGARTVRALALVAEVVHGAPCRFSDPARFSIAHGGKDRHPFPVPLKTYDESIGVLRRSLDAAKLGDRDKLEGFARLEKFTRAIEQRCAPEADFDQAIAHERALSPSLDGRVVGQKMKRKGPAQLLLFD